MKERKLEQVCWYILTMIAVFIGLYFIKTAGAVFRTGIEAMWNSCNTFGEKVVTMNHFYLLRLNPEGIHHILETILWTPAVWSVRKRRVVNKGVGYFILMTLLILAVLEIFSYIAYILQFVGDACIAGISSKEPSLVLKNIVSWNRWLNVDWAGRICEAIVASTILAFVGMVVERAKRRRAEKERAAEEARLKREQKRKEKMERKKQEEADYRRQREHAKNEFAKFVSDKDSQKALPSANETVPREG